MPFDLAKANQLLDAAGYAKGGRRQAHEPRRLAAGINFSVQAGWIDYKAMADVVVNSTTSASTSRPTSRQPDSVDQQKKTGDFQLMLKYLHGGCDYANGHRGQADQHARSRPRPR